MAQPVTAGLPPGLTLGPNYIVRLTAVDPTSGDVVSGVNVSNTSLTVLQLSPGSPSDLQAGPFLLVPGPDTFTPATVTSEGNLI